MPRGQLYLTTSPSQRKNEVFKKTPLFTKKPSPSAEQSQERHRSHRRPKQTRSGRTASHRISPRSSDRHLDFANPQALDPPSPEIKRYVDDFVLDDSSKHTSSRNTDPDTISNQILPIPGGDQSSFPKSSDHTADSGATPGNTSDWKSTYAATKLAINLVKESSDVFPPLESVVGGLSAILDHCDVLPTPPKSNEPQCLRRS